MNPLKKILILGTLFLLLIQLSFAQTKQDKDAKNATDISKIEKEIKDAENAVPKKSTKTKKKASKQKIFSDKQESDSTPINTTGTGKTLTGIASFYSASFEGKQTANGEIFRHSKLTCASNKFPLGTWLKITNIKNNKTIVVKVNDRMHPRMKRLVDLTLTGAKKLDFVAAGLTTVKAEVLKKK
jgi:rare lipoprotein A